MNICSTCIYGIMVKNKYGKIFTPGTCDLFRDDGCPDLFFVHIDGCPTDMLRIMQDITFTMSVNLKLCEEDV